MKHLKFALFFILAAMVAFAQRGGGHAGGGGGHAMGGGGHVGSAGGMRPSSGGFSGGGMAHAPSGGMSGSRPGMGGGFNNGLNRGGFGGVNNGFRGGFNNGFNSGFNRFGGNRFFSRPFVGFGFGFGYPFYGYPYYGYSYGYPGYYNDGYYPYDTYGSSYGYDPYAYNSAGYNTYGAYDNGNYGYAPSQPPVVINQNLGGPTPPIPGTGTESFYRKPDYYLIAFSDHRIEAALTYRIEGDTIFWTTREREEKRAPLSSVDRRFTEQMNRDRHVEMRLQ